MQEAEGEMMKAKTTKEISEEYNHKAPDSLLCGGELWVSLDELRKELVHLFLFRKDCSKVCWTDFLDELFSSPSPLVACKKPLTKAKEGRAKERLIPKKLGDGAIPSSLALPLCSINNSQHSCCLEIKKKRKVK